MKRKKRKKPQTAEAPKQPVDPRLAAEALLRYRDQPGMKSRRRFINPQP
ncbi:MAG: hypothetical protein OXC98_01165 [bacterium]|nr:hypothetical protein [Acidimicrobiia bacterium]MCY4648964.1 hypothetical protein [bacterium]